MFESRPGKLISLMTLLWADCIRLGFLNGAFWVILTHFNYRRMSSGSGLPMIHHKTLDLSHVCGFMSKFLLVFQLWCVLQCIATESSRTSSRYLLPCVPPATDGCHLIHCIVSVPNSDSGRAYFFQGLSQLLLLKNKETFQLISSLASNHTSIVLSQVTFKPCWIAGLKKKKDIIYPNEISYYSEHGPSVYPSLLIVCEKQGYGQYWNELPSKKALIKTSRVQENEFLEDILFYVYTYKILNGKFNITIKWILFNLDSTYIHGHSQ